jgi:hypothetical protein
MNIDEQRLGVDIGRVIIDGGGSGDTSFFGGDTTRMLATPAVPDVVEALARLVPRFGGRVWLISKCGPRIQRRSQQWLDAHRFAERTGIPRANIRFCLQRPEKAIHCADLGITHFVDDKLELDRALRDVVPHRYLFGPQCATPPAWVRHTLTWADAEAAIVADSRRAAVTP